jgi:hypothetical protein
MNQSKEGLWYVFEQWALEGWRSGIASLDAESESRIKSKEQHLRSGITSQGEVGSRISLLFSIRCSPSFSNPINWKIYSRTYSSQKIEYWGGRREWDLNKDLVAFESAETLTRYKYRGHIQPTFYDTVLRLQLESIKPVLDIICSSSLVLQIPPSQVGCDGTSYQLVLGDFWAGITFNWWETGPQPWQDIVTSSIDTFTTLERLHSL